LVVGLLWAKIGKARQFARNVCGRAKMAAINP